MRAWRQYRQILGIADARALIGAGAASEIGNWLYNAALLAFVFERTHSAGWVGAATVFRLMPLVLLGPIGGVLADRYPRRTVLVISNLLGAGFMVLLSVVVGAHGPVVAVIALTALASAVSSPTKPASLAMLPRLVGEVRLGPANALLHTVQDVGVVLGPAIGAVLLVVAPAYVSFLANAVTFAVAALAVSRIRAGEPRSATRPTASSHLAEGFRTVRGTRFAVALIMAVAMVELIYGAQTVQLVVYARRTLGLGNGGYGVLLAASGVGGVLSAAFNGQLSTARRLTLVIAATGALGCVTELIYAGTGLAAIAIPVTVIGGGGLVACEVVVETALARIVSREVLGRVSGVLSAAMVAAMVLGAVLAPILTAAVSLRAGLLILGAATLLITAGCQFGLTGLDALSRAHTEALRSRLAVVDRLPVTAGAPQLALEQLASASQLCRLPPGVDVVVQGAPAHAFFAIVTGRVVVHRDGGAVVRLGPGDSFGERGLLDQAPRNATVTTEIETSVLRIDGAILLDVLSETPMLTPALERVSAAPGIAIPDGELSLLDDPRWSEA
jgi:MFS family permease